MKVDASKDKVTLSTYDDKTLPSLVGEAVLINPATRETAKQEVDSYIETMNNPVILTATGNSPLSIIDLETDVRATELVEVIKRWATKDTLKHDVDVTKLFPKWVTHEGELVGGGKMVLVSPIVSIDPTNYLRLINDTISWLRDDSRKVCTGEPKHVVVLPSAWINQGPLGYACGTGASIMLTELDNSEYASVDDERNTARHEVIHAALITDKERWGHSNARVMEEGVDQILEMLMHTKGDMRSVDSTLLISAITYVRQNPEIGTVGGFSEYATYEKNGIKPNPDGRYENQAGKRRAAEYFQGLMLSFIICSEYGGLENLRLVFKEVQKSKGSVEKRIERGLKKGLKLDRKGEKKFKEKYERYCNEYIIRAREWEKE